MTKQKRTTLKTFLASEKGFVGVVAGLFLIPTMTIAVGSFAIYGEVTNLTRAQQTVDAATLALANYPEPAREVGSSTWIDANTEPVHSLRLSETTLEMVDPFIKLSVEYGVAESYRWGLKLISRNGDMAVLPFVTSSAEFFYRPLELVMALDASASQKKNKMEEMIRNSLDVVYANQSYGDNVRISLFAYSEIVNLGSEYKDLISRQSRRLSPAGARGWVYDERREEWIHKKKGSPVLYKTQRVYDEQKKTLSKINAALVEDLLSEGGPGQKIGYAPVNRKPLKDVVSYVDLMEQPPMNEEDKFELVINDGRWSEKPGGYIYTYPTAYWDAAQLMMASEYWQGVDIREWAVIPKEWWEESYTEMFATSPDMYSMFGDMWGIWPFGKHRYGIVTANGDASRMSVLAGETNPDAVMKHMENYSSGTGTSPDEAFAWGYRLLNPNWSSAWKRGANFPTQYHSDTEKHLMIFAGRTGAESHLKVIPEICRRLADNGIRLSIFLPTDDHATKQEKEIYQECALCGEKNGSIYREIKRREIYQAFAEAAGQVARVRLISY